MIQFQVTGWNASSIDVFMLSDAILVVGKHGLNQAPINVNPAGEVRELT